MTPASPHGLSGTPETTALEPRPAPASLALLRDAGPAACFAAEEFFTASTSWGTGS